MRKVPAVVLVVMLFSAVCFMPLHAKPGNAADVNKALSSGKPVVLEFCSDT